MRIVLVFLLTSSLLAGEISLSAGQGTVQGNSASSFFIDSVENIGKKSLFGRDVLFGLGWRLSHFQIEEVKFSSSDTLEDLTSTNINIMGEVEYRAGGFGVGFNLDLLGLNMAGEAKEVTTGKTTDAYDTNIFLVAENDRGALASQFFLRYTLDSISFKAGTAHNVVEFLENDQGDRRQKFFDTYFLTLSYRY